MAEKMPSSVIEGSRPISFKTRSYSSGFRPCAATSAALIFGCFAGFDLLAGRRRYRFAFWGAFWVALRAAGFLNVRVVDLRDVLAIGLDVIAGPPRQSTVTMVPQMDRPAGPRGAQ
jgi:hypothetical protein